MWRSRVAATLRAARRFSSSATPPKPRKAGPIGWPALALAVGVGAGGLAYFEKQRSAAEQARVRPRKGPGVGTPAVGGPFRLTDTDGKPYGTEELKGKFALLYFGFTHCPDVCPDELEKVTETIEILTRKGLGDKIVPVFITLDPQRDSAQRIKEYLQDFHPTFVGLTGSPDEIKEITKKYRVYYTKANQVGDDYLIDHSILEYLIDDQGIFRAFYGKNVEAKQLAEQIEEEMRA